MNSVLIGSGVALMAVAVAGPAVLRKQRLFSWDTRRRTEYGRGV